MEEDKIWEKREVRWDKPKILHTRFLVLGERQGSQENFWQTHRAGEKILEFGVTKGERI